MHGHALDEPTDKICALNDLAVEQNVTWLADADQEGNAKGITCQLPISDLLSHNLDSSSGRSSF